MKTYIYSALIITVLLAYYIPVAVCYRQSQRLNTQYKVGAAKQKECGPAYMLAETGEYEASTVIEPTIATTIRVRNACITINVVISCIIVAAELWLLYGGFITNIKNPTWYLLIAAICVFFLFWLILPAVLAFKQSSRFAKSLLPNKKILPWFSLIVFVSIIVPSYIIRILMVNLQLNQPSLVMFDVLPLRICWILFVVITVFTSTIDGFATSMRTANDDYANNFESINKQIRAFWPQNDKDVLVGKDLYNKDLLSRYLAANVNAYEMTQYGSRTLPDRYWKKDAAKYMINREGLELDNIFPETVASHTNIATPDATADADGFASKYILYATSLVPKNTTPEPYFQYGSTITSGTLVNLINFVVDTRPSDWLPNDATSDWKHNIVNFKIPTTITYTHIRFVGTNGTVYIYQLTEPSSNTTIGHIVVPATSATEKNYIVTKYLEFGTYKMPPATTATTATKATIDPDSGY